MRYLADLFIIAIILVFAVVGWKRGFIKTLTGFASSIISTILAIIFYRPLALLMEMTPLYTGIRQNILNSLLAKQGNMLDAGSRFKEGAEAMIRQSLGLPKFLSDIVAGWIPNPVEVVTTRQIAETVSMYLAKIVIGVISLILILILVRVGLIFAKGVLSVITKLPVIHQVDSFFGFITGTLQGFLLVFVLLTLLVLLGSLPAFKEFLGEIDKTIITKFIFQNNPITGLMFPKGGL